MRRFSVSVAAAAAALAFATTALAAGAAVTHYEAGRTANGPFAILAVTHHRVVSVRWRFLQTHCEETLATPAHATATLNARIGRGGHFARTVKNPFGGTTAFSGTVSATRATVKIVNHDGGAFSYCAGKRTFHARLVSRVH